MAIPYSFSEDRDDTRFDHISPLQVKDLSSGKMYEARMRNHSNGGIYFESDGLLQKGAKIYICIQNSPNPQSSGVLEYYTGKVMWRKYLKRSFFYYGYGVQMLGGINKQNMHSNDGKKGKDSRKYPRKPFCRTVGLSTKKNGIFKGRTKNVSASGVFISSDAKLELGQELRLILPVKGKKVKIEGQIVWLNDEGFGLKFKKIQ
jgi:Tfp pilus assembly protein PilZ